MLRNRDIILIASAPWKTHGMLNCHHVAKRLARDNRVLYVESPGLRTPDPFHGDDLRKVFDRLRGWFRCRVDGPVRVMRGLHVLSPLCFPFQGSSTVSRLNSVWLGHVCTQAARALGFRCPLLWTFIPIGTDLVSRLDHEALIYHCVDDYAGNPGVDTVSVEERERRLAAAADLAFATSRPLAERLKTMGARVTCVPNVAEVERFLETPAECPVELRGLPRPVIGYVGNLASYKVDFDLIDALACRRRDWSFVLIGQLGGGDPATRLGALGTRENVFLPGPRSRAVIPAYVHGFDICLLPFRRSRVTDRSLPLKTFEYLASGKPVVGTSLKSLVAEPLSEVIAYADSPGAFIEAIETSLAGDTPGRRARRRRVASKYSWSVRFPQISSAVAGVLDGKRTERSHDIRHSHPVA